MKQWINMAIALAVVALVTPPVLAQQAPPAQGQAAPKAECLAKAPDTVDGQVESVDQAAGKVRVKDSRGQTHEFQASRDMLQTMKPGDKIEARLREAPKC